MLGRYRSQFGDLSPVYLRFLAKHPCHSRDYLRSSDHAILQRASRIHSIRLRHFPQTKPLCNRLPQPPFRSLSADVPTRLATTVTAPSHPRLLASTRVPMCYSSFLNPSRYVAVLIKPRPRLTNHLLSYFLARAEQGLLPRHVVQPRMDVRSTRVLVRQGRDGRASGDVPCGALPWVSRKRIIVLAP